MTGVLPAAVTGSALGVIALVGTLLVATRRLGVWPEVAVGIAVLAAFLSGGLPTGPGAVELWGAALLHPTGAWLLGLTVFWAFARERAADDLPSAAILGGLFGGGLPTARRLLDLTRDPGVAGRLVLLAVAAGAMSPLGHPAVLLLAAARPGYSLFAVVPASLAVAAAWPWPGRTSEPARWVVGAAVGLLVSFLAGPLPGIVVAGVLVALLSRTRPAPARVLLAVRRAVAVHLLASVAQLTFVASYLGQGGAFVADTFGGVGLWAAGAALGLLGEPLLVAAVLARAAWLSEAEPALLTPLVLGLALSPTIAVALAARTHGRGALRIAAPVALLHLALGGLWVAFAPW